jgi:xylulokinase
MSYLGIDIGTSSTKGLVINEEGKIIASDKINYGYISSQKGWVELDPNLLVKSISSLIGKLSLAVNKSDRIKCISFSTIGTAYIPIDKNGNTINNAISSLDTRSKKYLDWFEKKGLDSFEIYKITGQPRKVVSFFHNVIWLKENLGNDFSRIFKFLSPKDFFLFKMGLKPVTDFTQASRTMFYDFKKDNWSGYICELLGLDINILPEIVSPNEIMGNLPDKKIYDSLNLKGNVKITAGAHDTECCALGANITDINSLLIVMGTHEEVMNFKNKFDPSLKNYKKNIIIEKHLLSKNYIYYSIFYTGLILEWIRKIFFSDLNGKAMFNFKDIYKKLENNTNNSGISIIPYLKGSGSPEFDDSKKSIISNLDIQDNKYDIVKAFIEASNFCMKKIMDAHINKKLNNIFIIGGGSESDFLLQNKADVLGIDLRALKITEAGAYGAAIIAYCADKESSYEDALKILKNGIRKIYRPDNGKVERYQTKYEEFLGFAERAC